MERILPTDIIVKEISDEFNYDSLTGKEIIVDVTLLQLDVTIALAVRSQGEIRLTRNKIESLGLAL